MEKKGKGGGVGCQGIIQNDRCFFFYILFHRNIPISFADVVVAIVVVVVLKTVPGVFGFFFKLLVFPITIPDITRTKRIQIIIYQIACLLRKCSHLE